MDETKCENAARVYRQLFDDYYDAIVDFLTAHGDLPIDKIDYYSPHFTMNDKVNLLDGWLGKLVAGADALHGSAANGQDPLVRRNAAVEPVILNVGKDRGRNGKAPLLPGLFFANVQTVSGAVPGEAAAPEAEDIPNAEAQVGLQDQGHGNSWVGTYSGEIPAAGDAGAESGNDVVVLLTGQAQGLHVS